MGEARLVPVVAGTRGGGQERKAVRAHSVCTHHAHPPSLSHPRRAPAAARRHKGKKVHVVFFGDDTEAWIDIKKIKTPFTDFLDEHSKGKGGVADAVEQAKAWISESVGDADVAGAMPSLPDPRCFHSVSCSADGRAVVCGGYNHGGADEMGHLTSTALQWLPGTSTWSPLPDLPVGQSGAASVRLPDGRTMLIGGWSGGQAVASVVVLAADGSGWSDLPPLTGACAVAAAALLPDGKVLVAGGQSGAATDTIVNSAELWDPAMQKWTALPPMAHKRAQAAVCVLPSGRVAVVGGRGTDNVSRKDGEVFDPVKREWKPLGAEMTHKHGNISAVAVAGGLIVVGGENTELYDEESGRWITLPHRIADKRLGAGLVSVPAAALLAAAAAH